MAEDGRHVVVVTCTSDDQAVLLREVANACTQLLLETKADLADRQTVSIESVDVVTAHGGPWVHFTNALLQGTGQHKAVVVTGVVKTKPAPLPEQDRPNDAPLDAEATS